MIIFKKIKWKNFLSTGNAFVEINLNKNPSTLIIGENGAGKSTILDALCFSLFGKPFRNINKPQLINSVNERDLQTEVEFEVSGKNVKVLRGLKPNKFEIYVNDIFINQDAAVRDYQDYLEQQILKLNYKSFTQVVILGSSTFVPFMQLKAKERREVVEDILDIKIFSLMNIILKTQTKLLIQDIKDLDNNIFLKQNEIDLHQKYLEERKSDKKNIIEEKQKKIEQNNNDIKQKKIQKEKIDYEIRFCRGKITDERAVLKRIEDNNSIITKIETKLNDCRRDLNFFNSNNTCPTCTQEIQEDFRNSKIKEKTEKKDELVEALSRLNLILIDDEKIITNIKQIKSKISDTEIELANIDFSLKTLDKSNKELELEQNNYESKISFKDENLKLIRLKESVKILKENLRKKNEDKAYLDVLKNLLQDDGIKTKIIKKYLPIMNKLVNTYLSNMDFYAKFSLDENFNEKIESRYRDEFSYDSFSEGEKMRIDLSLLFTWRAIARMKNSTNTNLLILDEIFDSSLDAAGTDDFLKILNTFVGQNVFIISHKQDILIDKFVSVIQFKKEKNFSEIEE